MSTGIGVLREVYQDEHRVALVPEVLQKLLKLDVSICIQSGAGNSAYFSDAAYNGAAVENDPNNVLQNSDILLCVQPPTPEQVAYLKDGSCVIGFMQPHQQHELLKLFCEKNITSFAMELVPRISRAQSMDALSSQAAIAGYQAVLIAASTLDKFVPMLTTAAGTIRPAQFLIIGAGVAGLQAIATARRLGAVVEGFDVRPETREQIESLGAKFVDTGVAATGEGGYARELTDTEKAAQQEALNEHIAKADAIISTAAVPGRPAPRIISAAAVGGMKPGSVIIDLGAESGGNCELTEAGTTVTHNGVRIVGPVNLPSTIATHASEMYSRNLFNFLAPAIKDGQLIIDWEDEVFAGAVLTKEGQVTHGPTRDAMQGGAS